MRPMLAILSLLIGAVGWYYLFYSQAAQKLGAIEDQKANQLRGVLRRTNAIVMLLMALGIAFGTFRFEPERQTVESLLIWLGVIVLLFASVVLALIDVRLTRKLRRSLRERTPHDL